MDLECLSTILDKHQRGPFINIDGSLETVGCNFAKFAQLYLLNTRDARVFWVDILHPRQYQSTINVDDINEYPVFYESYYEGRTYSNYCSERSYMILTNLGNIYTVNPYEEWYCLNTINIELGYKYDYNTIEAYANNTSPSRTIHIISPEPKISEDENIVPKLFVDVLSTFLKAKMTDVDNGDFKKLCVDYMQEIKTLKKRNQELAEENAALRKELEQLKIQNN